MAKDPAMLWYWSDWNSGTSLYTRFLKGCYIDILHAQFNNGHLSLEEIKTCLGADFGSSWPTLQKKFKQDGNGLFFNDRLEQEKEKRQKYSESRRKNKEGSKKSSHDDTHDKHMSHHVDNENENPVLKEIGSVKTKQIASKVWEDQGWREQVCMGNNLSMDHLRLWMAKFNASIMNDTIHNFSEKTYKKMFQGWVDFQKGKGVKVGGVENHGTQLSKL